MADCLAGARFLGSLPGFLRRPFTAAEAHAALRHRLAGRAASFFVLTRHAIYGHAASPYRELISLAGCEYGDLGRLVVQDGLEAEPDAVSMMTGNRVRVALMRSRSSSPEQSGRRYSSTTMSIRLSCRAVIANEAVPAGTIEWALPQRSVNHSAIAASGSTTNTVPMEFSPLHWAEF